MIINFLGSSPQAASMHLLQINTGFPYERNMPNRNRKDSYSIHIVIKELWFQTTVLEIWSETVARMKIKTIPCCSKFLLLLLLRVEFHLETKSRKPGFLLRIVGSCRRCCYSWLITDFFNAEPAHCSYISESRPLILSFWAPTAAEKLPTVSKSRPQRQPSSPKLQMTPPLVPCSPCLPLDCFGIFQSRAHLANFVLLGSSVGLAARSLTESAKESLALR